VAREASSEWRVLAERCFHALDHDRVRFRDLTGKCAVAVAPVIAVGVGVCILAALELAAEAVVVVGSAAVVAAVINEEIAAYERRASIERASPKPRVRPPTAPGPVANREPEPEGYPRGGDLPPIPPPDSPDHDRRRCLPCTPVLIGGLAYEYHSAAQGNVAHDGMDNHTHHFRMNQSPPLAGCKCFWVRNFIRPTEGFSPMRGAVPVQPAGGGGVAP